MGALHEGHHPRWLFGRGRALVLFLLVGTLLAAACGTRLPDEERAAYHRALRGENATDSGANDGSNNTGSRTSSGDASGNPGAGTAGTANGGGATTQPPTDAGGGGGGDQGGGDQQGGEVAVAEPCVASASGEKGVTDTTITIGNVSQLSGPVAGFAQQAVNGAQAYVAFVNATGGLCGRELRLEVADDGFDASRNAAEAARMEPNVLAFGAGFSVADSGMRSTLEGTNVLDIGIATSPERQNYANYYSYLPGQDEPFAAPEWKYAKAQGATKGIVVHVAAAAARNEAINVVENMKVAGIDGQRLEISNTQFDFAGPARKVKDSGAQIMVFISDINASVQMVSEMRELGPALQFEWYRIAYGEEFLDRAGSDTEGTMAFLEFLPFEEAGANEEMATYQEWLSRVSPGSSPTFESINMWISMKLLVQTIRGVQGDITRDALLESIGRIDSYDAGGLIQPVNIAAKTTDACKLAVRVVDGRWVREAPNSGFLC